MRPPVRIQVGVGLVDPRPASAQLVPAEPGCGAVLHGVIAHRLILGSRVAWTDVDQLVMRRVLPRAERDAQKPGHANARRREDLHRHVGLDRAVLEVAPGEQRKPVLHILRRRQLHGFPALIVDDLGVDGVRDESRRVGHREGLHVRRRTTRTGGHRHGQEQRETADRQPEYGMHGHAGTLAARRARVERNVMNCGEALISGRARSCRQSPPDPLNWSSSSAKRMLKLVSEP